MILLDKGRLLVDFDKDTRNFIDAAGLNNDANLNVDGLYNAEQARMAVHYLVSGLKGIGVWDKMKAIYPFVGGTSDLHKWNLKDPRDLDVAYRLSFLGSGWTHNSNGIKGNRSTSYANTFLNPRTTLLNTENHLSVFTNSLLDNSVQMIDIGAYIGGGDPNAGTLTLAVRRSTAPQYATGNRTLGGTTIQSGSKGGCFIGTSKSNTVSIIVNGNLMSTANLASPYIYTNTNVFLGAIQDLGRPFYFTDRAYQFASIGDGLSIQESIAMSHIVTFYQGILNRK